MIHNVQIACNHMFISNTQFVGNYAEDCGGAVALYGCIGAELYIDESDFYNNTTPIAGGHITLQLNNFRSFSVYCC